MFKSIQYVINGGVGLGDTMDIYEVIRACRSPWWPISGGSRKTEAQGKKVKIRLFNFKYHYNIFYIEY
jgi:hypothetical protein